VEGFSIDKPIIKAGEEFTVAFDDPTHAAATWVIKASENDEVKGTFNANSFTTSLNEEGIYDLYLTMNGTTEIYRGKIQISPSEVGALPVIKSFEMSTAEVKGNEAEFVYEGRENSDGYVSRGMALGEKAFGIPASQLGFNDQTAFSLTFWLYINRFNHEEGGTQFLNIRTASDTWPASDWGFVWSSIQPENNNTAEVEEGTLGFSYRLYGENGGDIIEISKDFQFKPETWYHVAMVSGYTTNRSMYLYINGKLVGGEVAQQRLYTWQSSNVIMLGGHAHQRAGIDGTIDEVRLYKKALTANEIKATMQHTTDVSDPSFIGYWDFETEPNSEDKVLSIGYDKTLVAGIYDPTTISEGNNQYVPKPITFAAGAPFISGTNYKIETLPTWKFKGGEIQTASGDNARGNAVVAYPEIGTFPATLTLSNGWGSDTKTIEVVVVEPTGIEDVAIEDMQAFPNPFENEVYVSFVEEGIYTVELYDNAGRMLNQSSVAATAGEIVNIPVDGEAGIYFIKVKGDAGLLKVMKVAKK
ncbi:MAG: T9SS type A sorting domain-containing protein, partial [Bacteroidaceae bacterium]|nr:T9SS type A sorting domain-containing protein [Bacteroidaceae bacterium]